MLARQQLFIEMVVREVECKVYLLLLANAFSSHPPGC
jgi:hypothetical protein